MIYIVSGFPRSGTSTMMHVLTSGGLSPVQDLELCEAVAKVWKARGIAPPPCGFYESGMGTCEFESEKFPVKYDGKLIKVLLFNLHWLKPGAYRIVMMRRQEKDIVASRIKSSWKAGAQGQWSNERFAMGKARFRGRRDFLSVDEIWLSDFLDDPAAALGKLALSGWPIDVAKALAVVDHTSYEYWR